MSGRNAQFRRTTGNRGVQGLDEWGEPLTFTVPAPVADFLRTLVQNRRSNVGRRGCGPRRGGFQGRGQPLGKGKCHGKHMNARKGMGKKAADEEAVDDTKDEVDEEVRDLEKIESDDLAGKDVDKNSIEDVTENNDLTIEDDRSVPEFIKHAIKKAKDSGSDLPSWVNSLLGKLDVKADLLTGEVTAEPVISPSDTENVEEAVQERKIKDMENEKPSKARNFDENEGEVAPWLRIGELKNKAKGVKGRKQFQRDQRMKNLASKTRGNPARKSKKNNRNTFKGTMKKACKAKGNGKQNTRGNVEHRIQKKWGPNREIEIIITRTDKVRISQDKPNKSQKNVKPMKNADARAAPPEGKDKAKKVKAKSPKSRNTEGKKSKKRVEQDVVDESKEETNEGNVAEKTEPEQGTVVASANDFGLTQEELVQLFEVLKREAEN